MIKIFFFYVPIEPHTKMRIRPSRAALPCLLAACTGGTPAAPEALLSSNDAAAGCRTETTHGLRQLSPYADSAAVADAAGNPDYLPASYFFYAPAKLPASPRPLLIALHGLLETGEQLAEATHLQGLADRHGLVVAFPYRGARNWVYSEDSIDVQFVRDVVADIRSNHACVDGRRIYATGHSNGAFLAQRLACDAGDLFAAAAPYASSTVELLGRCDAGQRAPEEGYETVPIMMVHGDDDSIISFRGGWLSLLDWVRRYDCDSPPIGGTPAPYGEQHEFANCRTDWHGLSAHVDRNRFVGWRVLYAHNHGWPDGCGGTGVNNQYGKCDPSAPPTHITAAEMDEELWTFLSAHQRLSSAAEAPVELTASLLAAADASTVPGLVPGSLPTNSRAYVSARRVDVDGNTLDDQGLHTEGGQLTIRLAIDVTAGANPAAGTLHPLCPTATNGPGAAQYVAGMPVTISIEGRNWSDEVTAHTEILEAPRRAVAVARFASIPSGSSTLVIRGIAPADFLGEAQACGTTALWFKQTLPVISR